MSVYLHDIPLDQAQTLFHKALQSENLWQILRNESLPLDENLVGRVLAESIWAKISSPHYHASAMDGFAVRSSDTIGATPTNPLSLRIDSQATYVDTGDPLPEWANAIIPIEQVESLDASGVVAQDIRHPYQIIIRAALTPWAHVRPMGEDMVATQLVLPVGHVLRPVDLGAIAASGNDYVCVSAKPIVSILPTGTELIPIGKTINRGDIIEFNSIVLAAQLKNWGADPRRFPVTPDNIDMIRKAVQQAADSSDLVLLNAGSSAGSEDFSSAIVEELGELLVHGVAVRPGHPVILGMVRRSANAIEKPGCLVPIIGIPGYPVSAALTGEIFVEPLIAKWLGRLPHEPHQISATLTRKLTSPAGDDDFVRMVVGRVADRLLAAPQSRGAGVISSLVKADGITILPRGVQGMEAGSQITVNLYRQIGELERTIFVIGSHDMTLDLLAQYLSGYNRRLVSTNAGSLGGLIALKRGEAHLAGSHLLNPQTGQYNTSYIKQYLPDTPVCLLSWVGREQGLIVAKGNPKKIKTLGDIIRPDVTFINRQRGAGTRVLLDYEMSKISITPDQVHGYDQEEYTHLGVSAAVASGRADCGLGIAAAACALGLDFISLFTEHYDLVIPEQFLSNGFLEPLFSVMEDPKFRQTIKGMAGYDISCMGTMIKC